MAAPVEDWEGTNAQLWAATIKMANDLARPYGYELSGQWTLVPIRNKGNREIPVPYVAIRVESDLIRYAATIQACLEGTL